MGTVANGDSSGAPKRRLASSAQLVRNRSMRFLHQCQWILRGGSWLSILPESIGVQVGSGSVERARRRTFPLDPCLFITTGTLSKTNASLLGPERVAAPRCSASASAERPFFQPPGHAPGAGGAAGCLHPLRQVEADPGHPLGVGGQGAGDPGQCAGVRIARRSLDSAAA